MHEHIDLLSCKSCMNLENGASSEEITHLVKVPRYVRFFNSDWMELVAEVRCSLKAAYDRGSLD